VVVGAGGGAVVVVVVVVLLLHQSFHQLHRWLKCDSVARSEWPWALGAAVAGGGAQPTTLSTSAAAIAQFEARRITLTPPDSWSAAG
jgi:hypothetical protein